MNELIKITKNEQGSQVVSARELYDFLGYDKSQWSRWNQKNIIENPFAIENEDWVRLDIMSSPTITKNFALTIDFSKRLAMMARTEQGEQARLYFIECEKQLKGLVTPKRLTERELLMKSLELLDRAELAEAKVEEQKEQLIEQAPKVDFYDAVTGCEDCIDIGAVSRVLNMGIGRNKLFELLRQEKILMNDNAPYQNFVNKEWFRLKTEDLKEVQLIIATNSL